MYIIFLVCIVGMVLLIPVYFLSVEHLRLQEKYGKKKGLQITEIYGLISGWGFFIFLFGIWISFQPKFEIPIFQYNLVIISYPIPLFHLILALPIISTGAWFGIVGVKEVTLKVAETHRPVEVISTGIYSKIRHPQYFGAILSHIGISLLLSSLFSILSTPLIIVVLFLFSWKEEKELLREFGKEYEKYLDKTPMLIPRVRIKKFRKKNMQ
ncbi:MAG: isoprenylcysteine carboxylmethyltransferase family protein [Candidatus Lokiarchaeota archaeon]|nr:isoprenylcysteine carboxylmethyltransferase family protein [Candidatus Lokiarchaeota archaeon]